MDSIFWLVFVILLVVVENVYFLIAKKAGIVDRPNHRTMHEGAVIRGGGIIFYLAVLLYEAIFTGLGLSFMLGISALAIISFVDDLKHLPSALRSSVQLLAVAALVWSLGYFSWSLVGAMVAIILFVGVVNAYNFMDGINGITGGYSLVFMVTVYTINQFWISFISSAFLWAIIAAILVFNFYNFRKKARCFAGDIGSISMAFIVIYIILQLIKVSGNPIWILLLTLYGMDTVATIIQRIFRKENIFEAHRLHLFQVGIYKGGLTHLQMTTLYMGIQLLINVVLIYIAFYISQIGIQWMAAAILLVLLAVIYAYLKFKVLKLSWK